MPMNMLSTINRLSPALTALLIAGTLVIGGFRVRVLPGTQEYFRRVKERVDEIPYKIGSWLGKDIDTSPYAVKLLKPNVILQRSYTDREAGRTVQLLVVHCGNARDMDGHYPPVCYPAHGWTGLRSVDTTVRIAGASLPAKKYTYSRVSDGLERRMSVVNFFVLPRTDVQFFADRDALSRASQSVTQAGLGVAQIQLVSLDEELDPSRPGAVDPILESLEPVLKVVAAGVPRHGS